MGQRKKEQKVICAMESNKERKRKMKPYRMIPLIGLMYRTFGKNRKENLAYFERPEKEIIAG